MIVYNILLNVHSYCKKAVAEKDFHYTCLISEPCSLKSVIKMLDGSIIIEGVFITNLRYVKI